MTAQLDLTKPISAAMLAAAGACPEAVARARKHFGYRRLRLTRARLRKAARQGLLVGWLSSHLPPKQRQVFGAALIKAWQVYDDAEVEASRILYAAKTEPLRVYDDAIDEAWRVLCDMQADALADVLGLP